MRINPIEPILPIFKARTKDEFTAHIYYTNIANCLGAIGFRKLEDFFRKEAADEREHAQEVMNFVIDWGAHIYMPELPEIETPTDIKEMFNGAYEMEAALYESYCESMDAAENVDRSAYNFFAKKVEDQRKSVAEYRDYLDQLERYNTPFELEMFEDKYFG